jgi:esterase/lipase
MLKVFQGEQHADFLIECGEPAALLVHGFPGTPAEMRPLSPILHSAGWTPRGLLLPGSGAQIDSLVQRTAQEWIDIPALILQGQSDPVVKPELTRQLLQQLASPVEYVEIDAQHDLIDPVLPDWPHLEHTLRQFAEGALLG